MPIFSTQRISILIIASLLIGLLSSCSEEHYSGVEHSFTVALDTPESVDNYPKVAFKEFEDLNLGFYRGNVWMRLEIQNTPSFQTYMFIGNDRFSRQYKFYKQDTLNNTFRLVGNVEDPSLEDYRTFNNPNPNLKIDLRPNEHATYLITTSSDGRTIDATPRLVTLENYYSSVSQNTTWDIILYTILIFLLVINVYLSRIYKRRIYFYYITYILATLLVYLGIEGYLLLLKIDHLIIDHFVFITVKLWAFSLIMYTSKFLEVDIIAPKFFKLITRILAFVIGGTLLYQFIFFKSSIQYLHYFENLLTVLWLLLILGILIVAAKKRWLSLKYYLIPLSFFIAFTVFGIINVHLQIFSINSFTLVKVGAIFEFIGFTYFTSLLLKRKLEKSDNLQEELREQRNEIVEKSEKISELNEMLQSKTTLEKSDLLNIFTLLESSLRNQSDWDLFKSKFSELDPNFLNNLIAQHPDLSKTEIRLLTLIKIGYSQKEIADILNIAPDSVKKARSRVRKSLKLRESVPLNDYLDSL